MGLFAERVGLIDTENAFKIGPLIPAIEEQGKEVIKCNLGEPDFPVPEFIKEEVKRQLDRDNTHYCDPQGIPALRAAVAKHLSETRRIRPTADRVAVFPGAKPPSGLCQQTYCDPGDEIIYPSPGFPIYESFITYLGCQSVPLHLSEERNFSFSGLDIAPLITEKTKMIFLNFPSNPTGGVASPEQLRDIADVIRSRCSEDIRVFSDEGYEHILFDGNEHHSIISCPGMNEVTILVSGASKSFSGTGGRIGWALFPTVEEAEVFRNLNINYFSCIPPYDQEGARIALGSPLTADSVLQMVVIFQERRDLVVDELNAIEGIRCQRPKGAFYVAPDVLAVRIPGGDNGSKILWPGWVRGLPLLPAFLRHRHGVAEGGIEAPFAGLPGQGRLPALFQSGRTPLLRRPHGWAQKSNPKRDEARLWTEMRYSSAQ